MAILLFIDESGHDRKASPYEVLAGVAIEDRDLWNLIQALHAAEIARFGGRYSQGARELKGRKLLSRDVYRQAALNAPVADSEQAALARAILDDGRGKDARHIKALAMAKLAYAEDLLALCARFRCKAFASIVETDAPGTITDGLRKDYSYLFERFYYFLAAQSPQPAGIIVFDELEKSRSHILVDQCARYFRDTATGRSRAGLVVPEPFFVHSDLTTGIQIADIVAYIVSWGFRLPRMTKPAREELALLVQQVRTLRHRTIRDVEGNPEFEVWSFAHITDLRTRQERR